MDTEKTYNNPELIEEEEDINWALYVAKLWKAKWFILIWTVLFSVIGVFVALNSKKVYTANVMLAPEVASSNGSSGLRNIASMFGMGGMTGGNGTADALNISLFPEMASSTPFITDLFDLKVKPYVSKEDLKKGKPEKPETTLYRWILKKDEPKGFVASLKESLFGAKEEVDTVTTVNSKQLTKEQDIAVNALKKAVVADVDKKTGITTISVTLDDPVMAALVADTVCQRLQNKVIEYRTQKVAGDLDYYTKLAAEAKEKMIKAQSAYAASVDFDRSVILQSVSSEKERLNQEAQLAQQLYQQMEQQKEMAKAKYQEAKPVFAVVEPAVVPLKPTGTSRAMICMVFFMIGFAGSAAWKLMLADIVKGFLASVKENMNEKKEPATETVEA